MACETMLPLELEHTPHRIRGYRCGQPPPVAILDPDGRLDVKAVEVRLDFDGWDVIRGVCVADRGGRWRQTTKRGLPGRQERSR